MIAPSIDSAALATRLDHLPARLHDALARELADALRDRFSARVSFAINTTANTVTATIAPTPTLPRKRGREASVASWWGLRPRSLPRASARNKFIQRKGRA